MTDQKRAKFGGKQLTCEDCGRRFVFSEGEERFYESKGLVIPPKRCPACRLRRKNTINSPNRRCKDHRAQGAPFGARGGQHER